MFLFDWLPLWAAGLIVLLLLLVAVSLGYRSFRWFIGKDKPMPEGSGPDVLLSATLGLLALLLGFTFSLAMQRNEDRRDLVIDEANAIMTTWHRIEGLDDPGRTRLAALMRQYVEARVDWSNVEGEDELAAAVARSDRIRAQLWPEAVRALRSGPGVNDADSLFKPMNAAFEAASSRIARRADRLPPHIINLLLLFTIISAALIGWRLGAAGYRYRVASFLILLLLTLSIATIVDLDRPRSGSIMISQQPMIDVQSQMR